MVYLARDKGMMVASAILSPTSLLPSLDEVNSGHDLSQAVDVMVEAGMPDYRIRDVFREVYGRYGGALANEHLRF